MRKNQLLAAILLTLLALPNASAIADCAVKSYADACLNCDFDDQGRVDKACQDGYKDWGKKCTMKAYPVASMKYLSGYLVGDGCPAMEACVEGLKGCDSTACPGNAREDCMNPTCKACYVAADNCAYRASKDCSAQAKCGDKKCGQDKGETKETCCRDCGCENGKTCIDEVCREPEPEPDPGKTPEENIRDTVYDDDYYVPGYSDMLYDLCPLFMFPPLLALGAIITDKKKNRKCLNT